MSEAEAVLTEDQSHYEISLTAGQAFVAFVLLLLSLAASFAFGLLIGKGQNDGFATKKDTAVINEAQVAPKKKVVELPVDEFKPEVSESVAPLESAQPRPAAGTAAPVPAPATHAVEDRGTTHTPVFAQLLSSSDQKAAEALAEKLIGGGFNAAYVERMTSDKGAVFRVRVKFASEAEARAAEAKLKTFSKEVWITH